MVVIVLKNKEFYTAQELTELQITLLPKTVKGIIARAKKENWLSRPRQGRGGGLEYAFSGLPREVQIEIETQVTKALILASTPTKKAVAIKQGRDTKTLSHKDRRCVDNRLLMALLVEQYTLELGSQDKALKFISSLSRNNALPTIGGTDYNVVCANAKASNHGTGVGVRKLHEWVLESKRCHTPTERLSMLAPAKQGRPKLDVMRIGWLPDFLAVYRNPNGLPFSKSYQIFAVNYVNVHGKDTLPSLNQVRKALNELPPVVRERGRKTGSQLKALDAYIQRDWNAVHIKNNSVWVGDGHSLKLKVRHPKSGAGFTPELTVIMDAPSRYIVGFSLSYSESGFAVLDALKMGIQNHGVPAIYYSDNGSGQFNEMLDNEITGILPRLGITHKTGIPGNPQGRGIIERFMKEVPKMIAQSFDSYYGKDGDQDTVRQRLKAMQSHAKALTDGKVSGQFSPLQQRADKILPTWDELYHTVKEAINWYNNEHRHRSIGQMTPSEKRSELDMLHGSERIWLNEMELKDLACPVFKRVVERGVVRVDNNSYFAMVLTKWHKQEVFVYVDQHDASAVVVRDANGVYICTADYNGNAVAAMPKAMVEKAEENRENKRIQRKENDIKQIKAQKDGNKVIRLEQFDSLLGDSLPTALPKKDEYASFLGDLKAVNY